MANPRLTNESHQAFRRRRVVLLRRLDAMQFMDAMLSSSSEPMMAILELWAFFCSLHKTIANRIKVVASILSFLRFVYPIFTVCLWWRRLCPCFGFWSNAIFLFFQPLKLSFEADQSRQLVHSIHDVVFQSCTRTIDSGHVFKLKGISR